MSQIWYRRKMCPVWEAKQGISMIPRQLKTCDILNSDRLSEPKVSDSVCQAPFIGLLPT